jgi:nucleoside-triphosphatase THEP1
MPRLIGIKGLAGHGKDTVANFISDYLSSSIVQKISFAEPLKEMVSIITGIPVVDIDKNKTTYLPEYNLSVRTMLQKVGTDAMRNQVDSDVWIKIAARRIGQIPLHKIVVIPDVRFENEMNFIRQNNGIVICVHRPVSSNCILEESIYQHISEKGQLMLPDCDHTIVNDGSLEDLQNKVYRLMGELFQTYSSL